MKKIHDSYQVLKLKTCVTCAKVQIYDFKYYCVADVIQIQAASIMDFLKWSTGRQVDKFGTCDKYEKQ